jgi:hypothetical protein
VKFEAKKTYVVSCSQYKHLRGFGYGQHATLEPPRALFMYAGSVACERLQAAHSPEQLKHLKSVECLARENVV